MSDSTTRQATLGAVDGRQNGASERTRANGQLEDVLAQPTAVESLTPLQVKDVWVRGKLMRDIIEQYETEVKFDPGRGNPMAEAESAEAALSEGRNPYSKLAGAGDGNSPDPILTRQYAAKLRERSHAENVEALFERFTVDAAEVSREPVEIARQKVKMALRGCGMPRINVQRDALRFHQENPNALVESQ